MKRFICIFLLTISFIPFSCKSDDGISYEVKKVNNTVLSINSTTFLKTHFAPFSVKEVIQFEPQKPDGSLYEVNLNDQFLIDFDKMGNWTSIEKVGKKPLPKNVVHQSIQLYVSKVYKDKLIEKINREKDGFIVELTNDIDLEFNKNGEFVEHLP